MSFGETAAAIYMAAAFVAFIALLVYSINSLISKRQA